MSLNHLGSAIIHRVSDDANYHDGDRESKQVVSVPCTRRSPEDTAAAIGEAANMPLCAVAERD
jgi:hypothetical protein